MSKTRKRTQKRKKSIRKYSKKENKKIWWDRAEVEVGVEVEVVEMK